MMRVSEVAKQLNVSPSAVRTYATQGRIKYALNPGGQRVFTQESVNAFLGIIPVPVRVFYTRSSSGNKALLNAQAQELERAYGTPEKVYADSASGLSEKRKGLLRLLRDAQKGKFTEVCVTYEDRLSRFGVSYIKALLERDNVRVNVLHDKANSSIEDELLQDFMSLLASFSGRFYRLRSKAAQTQLLARAGDKLNE